jgi:hypothetical protein
MAGEEMVSHCSMRIPEHIAHVGAKHSWQVLRRRAT